MIELLTACTHEVVNIVTSNMFDFHEKKGDKNHNQKPPGKEIQLASLMQKQTKLHFMQKDKYY